MRLIVHLMTIATLALGTGLAAAAPAAAAPLVDGNGSETYRGAKAYAAWDATSRNLFISMSSGQLQSGYCADSWFDWATSGGRHYDPRLVRVCRSNTFWSNTGTTGGSKTERATDVRLIGMSKMASCINPEGTTRLTCANSPKNDTGQTFPNGNGVQGNAVLPNACVMVWYVYPNGAKNYASGGDPTDCSS